MKEWIASGLHLPVELVQQVILYLESCKGFEEDAKLFLFFLGNSPHYDLDWPTAAPLFMRYILHRDFDSLIGFYEQFRKKLKINTQKDPEPGLLLGKSRELHFELIRVLTKHRRYKAGKIILNELTIQMMGEEAPLFENKEEALLVAKLYAAA